MIVKALQITLPWLAPPPDVLNCIGSTGSRFLFHSLPLGADILADSAKRLPVVAPEASPSDVGNLVLRTERP